MFTPEEQEFMELSKEVATLRDMVEEDERRIRLVDHIIKEYGLGVDTITRLAEEYAY